MLPKAIKHLVYFGSINTIPIRFCISSQVCYIVSPSIKFYITDPTSVFGNVLRFETTQMVYKSVEEKKSIVQVAEPEFEPTMRSFTCWITALNTEQSRQVTSTLSLIT